MFWLKISLLGIGSWLTVEIIRDIYHWISHQWSFLYKLHSWHHRVFKPDLTPVSNEIYRMAQWKHDVPESLVMLACALILWGGVYYYAPDYHWGMLMGIVQSIVFLVGAIIRTTGAVWAIELTDLVHLPGQFDSYPNAWFTNKSYHWRHHFDNQNAYYSGVFTLFDRLMGTALSLKGKKIAVTGASGTMGRALLLRLNLVGAKVIALSSSSESVILNHNNETIPIKTILWKIGAEDELLELFNQIDILIINHGINVNQDRSEEAIAKSYEINTFSAWRLLELFLKTVKDNRDIALKEVWVNTSEAESTPAFSPLYELTKRAIGDLITLRRLDAPCVIRKLILGPFKSNLNPIGILSADWVAKQIIAQAQSDVRNIIVTINPITFIAFPIKEFLVSTYFWLFSRREKIT